VTDDRDPELEDRLQAVWQAEVARATDFRPAPRARAPLAGVKAAAQLVVGAIFVVGVVAILLVVRPTNGPIGPSFSAVPQTNGVPVTATPFESGPPPSATEAFPPLSISNATTLRVSLFVNGVEVGQFPAGAYADPIKGLALPDLPWTVEARTDDGRVLLSFTEHSGQVSSTFYPDGQGSAQGVGSRVDLSCGRLDVWSGPPLLGPVPGPGTPGDCVVGMGSLPPSLPPGISRDAAIAIAQQNVSPDVVLRTALAGPFGELVAAFDHRPRGQLDPGEPAADHWVWAVEWDAIFNICPPDPGSGCYQRPGVTTVVIDYATGEWITSYGYSPGP
jgi:hypothetical protein